MIWWLIDTVNYYWPILKLEPWYWGLVIHNQIVTWSAFAILAMFLLYFGTTVLKKWKICFKQISGSNRKRHGEKCKRLIVFFAGLEIEIENRRELWKSSILARAWGHLELCQNWWRMASLWRRNLSKRSTLCFRDFFQLEIKRLIGTFSVLHSDEVRGKTCSMKLVVSNVTFDSKNIVNFSTS